MLHGHSTFFRLLQFVSIRKQHQHRNKATTGNYPYLSCTLNSSSMSSSSQLSSQSLSPSDFAAPGATPPRCAKSVWESSQSEPKERRFSHAFKKRWLGRDQARDELTLDRKLLKLIILLQHAKMGDLPPLFWRFSWLGGVFWLGCCGGGGHVSRIDLKSLGRAASHKLDCT